MRQVGLGIQTDKTPAQYVALAQQIDRYDFDVVHVYCDLPHTPSYMPLALMAPQIRRARLGPAGVSLARMAPVDIAANTALLAQMARGGVSVGLVRGAWLEEHGVREVERPLRAMREGVAVIRHLLSGASGGHAGELYPLAEHVRAPWAQPGGVRAPVMIGSWGPRLSALAGEIAEELKVGGSASAAMVPYARGWLARGEERAGRAPGSVTLAVGAVSVVAEREGREVAREAARRSVALYLPVVAALDPSASVEPELIERVRSHTRQRDEAGAARLISDELLDRFAFSGDAGDLIRQAEALYDAGAARVEFGTPHGLAPGRGIRILGEQVIPALRGN